jgi:hypothetical protein
MELQFFKITTIYNTNIDHNASTQQCMSKVVEAYWIDRKPINFAFKLPDYVPRYHHISTQQGMSKVVEAYWID